MRHDIEFFVDVDQLVAQRREHDPADKGAGQRRIEDVGIFGEAEAQGLRRGPGRCEGRQQREPHLRGP